MGTATAAADGGGRWLTDSFLALSDHTPEGLRAELIDGEIVLSPPPDGHHEHILSRVTRQFCLRTPDTVAFSFNKGLALPGSAAGGPAHHVIPDLTAVAAARGFRGTPAWMPPAEVVLTGEVTGGNPGRDRHDKRRCYAAAGIPCHLLVDRERRTVSLCTEPSGAEYTLIRTVPFGRPLPLVEPFGFALETTDFG